VDFVTIRGRAGQASSDQRPLRALELVVGDLDGAIAYRERANIDLLIEINALNLVSSSKTRSMQKRAKISLRATNV